MTIGICLKGSSIFVSEIGHSKSEDRIYLKHISKTKKSLEKVFNNYIDKNKDIVLNIPITDTICNVCDLNCPGISLCNNVSWVEINTIVKRLINIDSSIPDKEYENLRTSNNSKLRITEIFHNLDKYLIKKGNTFILNKSLKLKLKQHITPYWMRSIDLYIWIHYFETLKSCFNYNFEGFSQVPIKSLMAFQYLSKLNLSIRYFESYDFLFIIELYRNNHLSLLELKNYNSIDKGLSIRLKIIKIIEKLYNTFIYNDDMDMILKNPTAFNSFILSIIGSLKEKDKVKSLPDYTGVSKDNFLIPIL